MVENMFFLDSKYLGMVGMPAPHPPTPPQQKIYFYWQGGNNFTWGNPSSFKECPCISKDFFDLWEKAFMSCERGSEIEIEIKGFPIYLTYEFLGGIFKKGNSHLRNPC